MTAHAINFFGLYICKYSYSPLDTSPNDNPEAELPLFAGDYLFILSNCDEDGFYLGETLEGKRGLVPSNFVEKVQNLSKESYQQILSKCNYFTMLRFLKIFVLNICILQQLRINSKLKLK